MKKLISFLNRLEKAKIYYCLSKVREDFVMVEIAVPGQRWEVEFSEDDVVIEKFIADGAIYTESELECLFAEFID